MKRQHKRAADRGEGEGSDRPMKIRFQDLKLLGMAAAPNRRLIGKYGVENYNIRRANSAT